MAFRITAAHQAGTVDIDIPVKGRKDVRLRLPKLNFLPREVATAADKWMDDELQRVTKIRAEKTKAGEPIRVSDPEVQFPLDIDFMVQVLRELNSEHADFVAELSIGERSQIWSYWKDQSNDLEVLKRRVKALEEALRAIDPDHKALTDDDSDLGKSEASSDSSE